MLVLGHERYRYLQCGRWRLDPAPLSASLPPKKNAPQIRLDFEGNPPRQAIHILGSPESSGYPTWKIFRFSRGFLWAAIVRENARARNLAPSHRAQRRVVAPVRKGTPYRTSATGAADADGRLPRPGHRHGRPQFEQKAAAIIGLYLDPPHNAAVFCIDEKSTIQALDRLD
jgi:hypothetical protein